MKKPFILSCLILFFLHAYTQNETPRQLYPGLFEAVQTGNVYPDNKTFVDAIPKQTPAIIMQDYQAQKDQPGFDLKAFVTAHFTAPASASNNFKSNIGAGIREHIDTLWQVLARQPDTAKNSSLLLLPHNYIVPGGRFREVYYWDSYFTMLGLQQSHHTKMIRNMIDNFAYLLDKYGHIPNGNRTYYLTRSQPPFFSLMIDLLAKDAGDSVYTHYQKELITEYAYFMQGALDLKAGQAYKSAVKLQQGEIMNRYWDDSDQPREESYKQDVEAATLTLQKHDVFFRNIRAAAASGWDFSSRWFGPTEKLADIQTVNLIPVDLNCLLYHLENTIARSYQLQGNIQQYQVFTDLAVSRLKAIQKYCWNSSDGWFLDYDFVHHKQSPIKTLAGVFPLEFKIATASQAIFIASNIKKEFLQQGGLVTTLNRTGQQWDAPNGWAPLEYMAIDGLAKYHQSSLARLIANRWIQTNLRVFNHTGKLMEKYNVMDTNLKAGGGEYALQDGFGWTNGVLLNLMNRFQLNE